MAQTFRRNNPGNIRYNPANQWQGQQGNSGGFVQFDTLSNGIRAFVKLLANYASQYNLRTVQGIVSRYAPPIENDTANYIRFVSRSAQVPAGSQLTADDYDRVIAAMIQIETGTKPNADTLSEIARYRLQFIGGNAPVTPNTPQDSSRIALGIGLLALGAIYYFAKQ